MIKETIGVMHELAHYGNPKTKLSRLLAAGVLTQVRRGLYVDGPLPPALALASVIFGPSYLSFEFALSFHGLIPERVREFTSASYGKNKNKAYSTPFGQFSYAYLPCSAYPYGIERREEAGYPYLIACPEKALVDLVYKRPSLRETDDITAFLFDDMRLDPSLLKDLEWNQILDWSPLYRGRHVTAFAKWGATNYA